MNDVLRASHATLNALRGCLVATLPADLDPRGLAGLQGDVLEGLRRAGARALLLDCSAIAVMDGEDFLALRRIAAMAALMGSRTVLVGLRPGVVAALVELDVDLDGLLAARTLDDALLDLEADDGARGAGPEDGG